MIVLLSVILMQLPGRAITVPGGQVDIDGDRIAITENNDGTMTIELVKDEAEDD